MVNTELVYYIKDVVSRGFTHAEVRKGLIKAGYPEPDVNQALSLVPEQLTFGRRWKLALRDPSGLFAQIKDEQGIGHAFSFLLMIAAIAGILFFVPAFLVIVAGYSFLLPEFLFGQSLALVTIGIFVLFIVQAVVGAFVNAGIIHFFARAFGGQGSYHQAFKVVAYSQGWWVPGALFVAVPVVGVFAFSLAILFVQIVGVGALYGLSRGKAALSILAPILFIAAVGFAFSALSAGIALTGRAVESRDLCAENQGEWCYGGTQGNSCGSRDDCLSYVAVDLESPAACTLIQGAERRDICFGTLAINSGDISLCRRASNQGECEKFFLLLGA